MTNTPSGVLIARAIHFLELAQLQLTAEHFVDASASIATAVENLERVEM